jgi:hypothetical protein
MHLINQQQEEPARRNSAVGTASSCEAAALIPESHGGIPQGLEAVACDSNRSSDRPDQAVEGDQTLSFSSREDQASKGLFAKSSIRRRIAVEREKATEMAQHAVGNARSPLQ